jgi:hypothetical protein
MRLRDLLEASIPPLKPDIEATISPTMVIPSLINSDTYKQYRYNVALAAVRAYEAGDVGFDIQSTWNESLAAIAYTDAELETIKLANKLMGVNGVMISDSKSHEPDDTNTVSPVAKFTMSESMRSTMDKISGE